MSNRPEESSESRQTAVTGNNVSGNLTNESVNQYENNIFNFFSDNPSDSEAKKLVKKEKAQSDSEAKKLVKKEKAQIEKFLKDWVYRNIDLEKEKLLGQVESERPRNHLSISDSKMPLPSGTRIIDIFDEALKKLLILGKPVSGKTIALWQLALELINRAEDTINELDVLKEPIPILLNLTTWKTNQSIKEWIIEQLEKKGVPSKLGREWFKNQKLLPLLDEFDLLETKDQEECINAINELLQQDDQPDGLVVCSCLDEYILHQKNKVKLKLEDAICLKPLTEAKLRDYFVEIEHPQIWEIIQEAPDLRKIVESPLFLSVCVWTLAPSPKASKEKQQKILQEWQQCKPGKELRDCFFKIFIQEMLNKELGEEIIKLYYPPDKEPSSGDTKNRLIQLAKIMKKNSLSEFLIENMQPSLWLSKGEEKAYRLIVRLVVGLTAGLTAGLYLWGWSNQLAILFLAILTGVITGAISYLFTSLIASFPKFSQLLSGMLSGLIFFVLMYSLAPLTSTIIYLENGNFLMLLTGIGVGVVFSGLYSPQIEVADKLEFDYRKAIRYSCFALLLGIFFVPIHFWIEPELYRENPTYAVYELFSFFLVGLSMGAIFGEKTKRYKPHEPNQGVLNLRNSSVKYFVIGGSIAGLFTVVMDGFKIIQTTGIVLTVGLLIGLIGSRYSGIVCIQHFVLRVMLYFKTPVPWDYANFLNYAGKRKLLQKVGGQYEFQHRLLQEYFAALPLKNKKGQ